MKKFISMVMAAAMVVSLVPATAFAATGEVKATAKVVDAWDRNKEFDGKVTGNNVPELQLKVTSVDYQRTTGTQPVAKVTVSLDNADFTSRAAVNAGLTVKDDSTPGAAKYFYKALTAAELAEVYAMYAYDGAANNAQPANGTLKFHNAVPAVAGEATAIGAAPSVGTGHFTVVGTPAAVNGASAIANRDAAFAAYCTANGLTAGNYQYGLLGQEGWVDIDAASPAPQFIALSDVVAYAATNLPATVRNGAFIDNRESRADYVARLTGKVTVNAGYTAYWETYEHTATAAGATATVAAADYESDEITITITGWLEKDDIISLDLVSVMDKTSRNATVSVDSDDIDVTLEDAVYVAIKEEGIKATLKKVADVAEEESINLEKDLVIEANVENFVAGQQIELKLSKGFEWDKAYPGVRTNGQTLNDGNAKLYYDEDEDTIVLTVIGNPSKITVGKTEVAVEAVSAKVDDVAKITAKAKDNVPNAFKATADPVEAVKVVGDIVTIEVDEDEELPVIYSGVNVDNDGITDDSDHVSLKVTMKESVKAALDEKKAFTLTLPEGVYATDVNVSGTKDVNLTVLPDTDAGLEQAFKDAYKKGEQECFEFARKTFSDSAKPFEFDFEMTLIAEPGFEGDVTLTLAGDGFEDAQEVKIAKFVAPYTVEAAQNDLIIDYRNTEVPTDIVIKEAEAGLWDGTGDDALEFIFDIDRMEFEKDATITVDKDSDMEVKALKGYDLGFKVTEESDDEAAVITISDISLYMGRSLAAGAYDLDLWTNAGQWMLTTDKLFTTDKGEKGVGNYYVADFIDADYDNGAFDDQYYTVKEGFVNIVTAGRDQDDASFTTKVIVPVGETKMYSGEKEIALDVPAYINAAGYTMLPVRAVAVALGVSNEAVQWDPATKTVIIMYGNRVITMTAGQKVIYATGTAIPARSAVEIKDGRAFLGLRDLATALGVTTVNYDAATKTATLN